MKETTITCDQCKNDITLHMIYFEFKTVGYVDFISHFCKHECLFQYMDDSKRRYFDRDVK